jgi:hypothetical protein
MMLSFLPSFVEKKDPFGRDVIPRDTKLDAAETYNLILALKSGRSLDDAMPLTLIASRRVIIVHNESEDLIMNSLVLLLICCGVLSACTSVTIRPPTRL